MDWLTFVARLIDALAWPVTVLLIIAVLRKPISGLIPLLQKLKYKDLELEFGRQIEEVRQEVQLELPTPPTERALKAEPVLERLAGLSPRSAVLEAWRQVEDSLVRLSQRHQIQLPGRHGMSPLAVIRALQQAEILDPTKANILHDLRALRNNAAHGPDFALSKDSAVEYGRVATQLVEYLDTL